MKIYAAMCAVMADAEPIAKSRKNAVQGYSFRGIDEVYEALQGILVKHKVFTMPTVMEQIREERVSKSGGLNIYSILKIKYTFYAEDGSSCESVVIGEGMDNGDKASNKGMSVGHKYALLQAFCVPTREAKDPENDSHDIEPKRSPAGPRINSDPGAYVITVGQNAGKRIDQLQDLKGWVGFHALNKKLTGPMLEAVEAGKQFLELKKQ